MTNDNRDQGLPADGSPLDWVRKGIFPEEWTLIPVAGKATYIPEWGTRKRSRVDAEGLYLADSRSSGFGVVTGELSGGLLAIDIDGPRADARFRAAIGDGYQAFGEEGTMSWTSGKPGRRQILYRVPQYMLGNLSHVTTVILQEAGQWELGKGDVDRNKGEEQYQEVVLRFNRCQSVLPRSLHPDTKQRYRFLNYNDGRPADAPRWLLDILQGFQKAQGWLTEAQLKELSQNAPGDTVLPERQIRGWFFGEDVQRALMPRLEELVFKHRTFDEYGWQNREGKNAQRMSGCPWHGGESGTAFQYGVEHGCWDCKACGVGGDVLDFIHKIESGDKHASRPRGEDLETYVARLAGALGFRYPEDANVQVTKRAPQQVMSSVAFHEELGRIFDAERNPAVRLDRMAQLAMETGRRMNGKECEAALGEYRYKKSADQQNESASWFDEVDDPDFIIPNMLVRPGQVILHAAGGVGKTSACLGLAKAIGTGTPMKVRGITVPVVQGPVLWIQSDQTLSKLKRDLQDNDIDPVRKDSWFHLRRGFQINHMREFATWVKEIKPALVVVDSIGSCSSRMQVSEIEKAFATPLYWYNEANGNPAEDGFPACAIIWIHHDNANGEVRGNRYLINAIDEQWHLRKLKDEEKDKLRQRGENPSSVRMIQIKKSRAGREGDLIKVIRDANFAYSLEDYTPTVRREDDGLGDPDPFTLVLDIVKRGSAAQQAEGARYVGLTVIEVWGELTEHLQGLQGSKAKVPSSKTVGRWLQRWVADGLMDRAKRPAESKGGQPPRIYRPRALPSISSSFTKTSSNPFQRKASGSGHKNVCPNPPEGGSEVVDKPSPVADTAESVQNRNPVVARDLGGIGQKTAQTMGREEPAPSELPPPESEQAASPLESLSGLAGAGGLPAVEPLSADLLAQGEGRTLDRQPVHDPRWDDFDTAFEDDCSPTA